jgi:hypothetical protein
VVLRKVDSLADDMQMQHELARLFTRNKEK